MLNTVSLDTNIIVRLLVSDNLEACKKVLNLLDQKMSFVVSDIAISETIYVLENVYKKSREEIVDLLNFFLTRFSDKVKYNRTLTAAAFPFYLAHPKVSFNDCCLASYAEIDNAEPLMTFDKKLASQHPSAKLLA